MPLGILSDSDFETELGKLGGVMPSATIVELPTPGRKEGDVEVPEVVRTIIGGDALENGNSSAKHIAQALNISDSSISAYKNGATSTSTYHKPDSDLKTFLDSRKRVIATKAQNTLLDALDSITPDKLTAAKARDLAAIARDMSATIRNLDEDSNNNRNNPAQPLVIFAPVLKEESSFEVINARD